MQDFEGKVAVITGGASGIGFGMAERFAAAGMTVVLADINADALPEAESRLAERGASALGVPVDVADPDQVEELARRVLDEFGAVHVLCNNAGVNSSDEPIWEISRQDWERVIDINLNGLFICSKAAVPHLRARGGGVIVNMSSMGAVGGANILAYSSAKAGVLALTRGLSQQLASDGIRVNAIMPGLVETPMTAEGPAIARARREQLPVFQPEEMARAVAYAAEHEELTGAFLQYVPTAEGPRFALMEPWSWEPLEL